MAYKKTKIKRPRINPEVGQYMASWHLQNPALTGVDMWNQLKQIPDRKWNVPSKRSVQDLYADVKAGKISPGFIEKERMWNLSLLEEHPEISSEAVAKILELKRKGVSNLSIRTAQWISRLCSLSLSVDVLYIFAWIAGYKDKEFDLSGLPHDTDSVTFESQLLDTLKDPIKANWTVDKWDKPLSEVAAYREETQKIVLKFYPLYLPPMIEELEANPTPEYKKWKEGYNTKENLKEITQMHQQTRQQGGET